MESGYSSAAAENAPPRAVRPKASPGPKPAIAISGLGFDYPDRRALDDVSLNIPEQCIFGFLGPNGSGKTTLFAILATLKNPARGHATILNRNVSTERHETRKLLGVAFQHPAVDPQLTCRENLIHHGRLYGMSRPDLRLRIDEVLERFSLEDRRNDRVGTLSGGLQRRLELSKAMLHAPRVLLLDEPSTGLDPQARFRMWEDLLKLKAETGVTIVLTTHLMEEADRCDQLAILNHGRVVRQGTPAGLKASVGDEVLYIEADRPAELAANIKTRFNLVAELVDGVLRLEESDAHKRVPVLVEAFPGAIASIRIARPTLEDVFIQATGSTFSETTEKAEGSS